MAQKKADESDGNSSGAYIAGGGLLLLAGVFGLSNDAGIGAVLATIGGGALLLVGLIIFAIAEAKKESGS